MCWLVGQVLGVVVQLHVEVDVSVLQVQVLVRALILVVLTTRPHV